MNYLLDVNVLVAIFQGLALTTNPHHSVRHEGAEDQWMEVPPE